MMRELDEDSIAYWAKRNPNIVVADEVLNEAMVNDGDGGFRRCVDRQDVLDYGADRVRRVKRKFRDDKLDPTTSKMKGGTVTTSLLVSHLPKSMCVEIPGFYPVLDSRTGEAALDADGEPMMRSRWVARDRDEARRYFQDVIQYLSAEAIPGGPDAVLGYDIQHSESTPHVQIIADTFAPDPKDEESLRVESSQAWFSHREVKDKQGRQKSGKTKLREYHRGLKQHLVDRGYDISPDFDEKRHLVGMGKEEYGRTMDAKRSVDILRDRAVEDHEKLNGWDAELLDRRHELEGEAERQRDHMESLERREADLPMLRRHLEEEVRKDGVKAAEAEIKEHVQRGVATALAPAQALLDRQREQLEEQLTLAAKERDAYTSTAAQFDQMIRNLQPLVKRWEQANPHTDKGARAQRNAARLRQFEQRASQFRSEAPEHDPQPGE
ncbi:hypothetical protein [Brachybacterium tyrofermentans]|uniref:hypothetical protein n=1 Tax=Brachybacterium tyrofermentans TaxID=47848 RepID=UPI001866125E|nr:hypothetical protein [Brachybacterium tyrofermentans]